MSPTPPICKQVILEMLLGPIRPPIVGRKEGGLKLRRRGRKGRQRRKGREGREEESDGIL